MTNPQHHHGTAASDPVEHEHHDGPTHAMGDIQAGHDHMGLSGHSGHGDHVLRFRRLFWWMLLLAVPVVAANEMFAHFLGYHLPDAEWVRWVSPVLGSAMFVTGGRPFLDGAVQEIRGRKPGMMLLIGTAISVAFVASWGATLGVLDDKLDFWWEFALLLVIMLLGHWIEMRSLARTTSALDSLAALLPDQAERIDGDIVTIVAPADLAVGDLVLVRPGSAVPADGVIADGSTGLDESMVTGESKAVHRAPGDRVVAGTVTTDSAIRVRVTATGNDTALAGIQRLVSDAQASSTRAQRIADTAAGWLFWFAAGTALLTAIVWTAIGMPDTAVVRAITVLVIACPHALGLAIPLVVAIATERAARGGVLIKDRLALETMRNIDTVVFDKTGTLTVGAPRVTGIESASGRTEDDILAVAAAVESDSEHPLGKAITRAAHHRGRNLPAAANFSSSPAVGVTATVDDLDGVAHVIRVGGPHLLDEQGVGELPIAEAWRGDGATVLHVLADGAVIGALRLADAIRPESREAIDALHTAGVESVMITGDAQSVADAVATELKVDRVYAGVRPEDKAAKVRELQKEGRRVAMVGDGVNDAPGLAQADVGIAIGAGTDVAIASAGVILASSDPRSVLSVIELSRASYRKMRQNLWWAAGYNLISVPLAAGILAPIGFVLPMSIGAILMSASTVVVALNAQLLRRLDLTPQHSAARFLGRGPDRDDD